jgi:hypothetical protein
VQWQVIAIEMIENAEFQSHYRTARSVVARLRFTR